MGTDIDEFYNELGSVYKKSPDEVESFLLKKLDAARSCCGFDPLEIMASNELGSYYRGAGRFDESIRVFLMTEKLVRFHIGADTVEYANVLNNMAGSYRLAGQLDKAYETFEKSAEVYENKVGVNNPYYCSLLNNLALVDQNMGRYEKAGELLLRALAIAEKLDGCDRETAITLGNLGALCLEQKQYDLAEEYMDRCIKQYDSMHSGKVHLAAAYNTLGRLYFEKSEYKKAKDAWLRSKELTLRYFGENHEYRMLEKNLAAAEQKLNS